VGWRPEHAVAVVEENQDDGGEREQVK
jgi:hypothetical protein